MVSSGRGNQNQKSLSRIAFINRHQALDGVPALNPDLDLQQAAAVALKLTQIRQDPECVPGVQHGSDRSCTDGVGVSRLKGIG